jgi:hypothetical protein
MARMKWDPWREIEDKCVRYTRAVGWPRTRGQEVLATEDRASREDIAETDEGLDIRMEIPEVKKEGISWSETRTDHGEHLVIGDLC